MLQIGSILLVLAALQTPAIKDSPVGIWTGTYQAKLPRRDEYIPPDRRTRIEYMAGMVRSGQALLVLKPNHTFIFTTKNLPLNRKTEGGWSQKGSEVSLKPKDTESSPQKLAWEPGAAKLTLRLVRMPGKIVFTRKAQ